MPVSVITDVITWIELIAQIGITTVELGVLTYLVFFDGWLDMIRMISFWLDKLVIKYIDKFYSYFDKILNGTIFTPEVVENVMKMVYIFVTAFVLFKLIMLLIKYIVNPDMVSDDKVGSAALVKRVIIGMVLLLFLNTIFDTATRLQSEILKDNLFGKILLDEGQLRSYEKNKDQMGRVLAFNVYQGFWNMDKTQVNSSNLHSKYDNAIKAKDPGVFGSINQKFGDDYAIDYFPVLSTVVLFYVLYLVIKYCLDIVVRMFKLFVLQMLGPLAITDYMINGNDKGMFPAWTKTTIAAYAMLFMRVFCIWFVAFVTILMNEECTNVGADGVCTDSMLYIVQGQDPDYLLRALITLGLLAFLMDLPKLLSEIFGLDLEQDASVKGLMQKVGGAAKMVGLGAVAAGGAAIGGAFGQMKSLSNGVKKQGQLRDALNKGKITPEQFAKASKQNKRDTMANVGAASGGALKGMALGAMSMAGAQGVGQSFSQGYGASDQNIQKNKAKRQEGDSMKDKVSGLEDKNAVAAERAQDILRDNVKSQVQNNPGANKQQIIDSVLNTQINQKLNGADAGAMTVDIKGRLSAIETGGGTVTKQDVVQNVQQVLSSKLDVTPDQTTQIVNQVIGNSEKVTPDQIDQVVNQVVQTSKDNMTNEVTQVVNQVMGTTVSTTADAATQTVNQISGTQVDGKVSDINQTVNQVSGTQVDTKVSDATQTVTQEIDSLFSGDSKIATRDSSGEYHVNFDDNTLSD